MARTRTGPTRAELVLLGLLADGPAHPYSLDTRLRKEGSWSDIAFSSIYAALDRLDRLGLVTSRPDAGSRGRARRVYRLTAQGRSALKSAARTALARPLGPRPNDLGVGNLLLLSRADALAAIGEARKAVAEEKKAHHGGDQAEYPANALALHRSAILAAEDRFYAELEKLVQKTHPERGRKRDDDD